MPHNRIAFYSCFDQNRVLPIRLPYDPQVTSIIRNCIPRTRPFRYQNPRSVSHLVLHLARQRKSESDALHNDDGIFGQARVDLHGTVPHFNSPSKQPQERIGAILPCSLIPRLEAENAASSSVSFSNRIPLSHFEFLDSGCPLHHHIGFLSTARWRHFLEALTDCLCYSPWSTVFTARSCSSITRGTLTVCPHDHHVLFGANENSVSDCQPWNHLHSGSWRFTPAESLARSLPSLFTLVSTTRLVTPLNYNHFLDATDKGSNFLDLCCFYPCHCTPIRSLT
jgi:hypothetical protein